MKNTEEALHWIIGIIKRNNIPYRISGGFAARLYGCKRELADIDIDIPDDCFSKILAEAGKYLIYGPSKYVDENWDLFLATLEFENQLIDLSGADTTMIFDMNEKKWVRFNVDFNDVVYRDVFGIKVPLIPKEELIAYKLKLRREVDISDVSELKKI